MSGLELEAASQADDQLKDPDHSLALRLLPETGTIRELTKPNSARNEPNLLTTWPLWPPVAQFLDQNQFPFVGYVLSKFPLRQTARVGDYVGGRGFVLDFSRRQAGLTDWWT
jgi:hypothetical protein